jgi:hypothetical protein
VRRALQKLPVRQREAVTLRDAIGLSEAAAAEIMEVSVGAVKRYTFEGQQSLRQLPRPGIVRVLMTSCPLCRVSVPGQPDGMVEMIAWPGSRQHPPPCNVFSAGIATFLFVLSSLPFPWITGAKDKHACFADAHEHCPGLSPVKCLARPHMNLWDMRSTLCSLRAGAHPRGLIVVIQ